MSPIVEVPKKNGKFGYIDIFVLSMNKRSHNPKQIPITPRRTPTKRGYQVKKPIVSRWFLMLEPKAVAPEN